MFVVAWAEEKERDAPLVDRYERTEDEAEARKRFAEVSDREDTYTASLCVEVESTDDMGPGGPIFTLNQRDNENWYYDAHLPDNPLGVGMLIRITVVHYPLRALPVKAYLSLRIDNVAGEQLHYAEHDMDLDAAVHITGHTGRT